MCPMEIRTSTSIVKDIQVQRDATRHYDVT